MEGYQMKTKRNNPIKKHLLFMVLAVSLSLAVTGCLSAPVEQGAVTNTEGTTESMAGRNEETAAPTGQNSDQEPTGTSGSDAEETVIERTETKTSATEPSETTIEPTREPRPSESTLTIELEGMREDIATRLFMSGFDYSIYYEHEMYQVVQTSSFFDAQDQVDEFMPLSPAEALPDISFSVGHRPSADANEAMTELKRKLEALITDDEGRIGEIEAVELGVDQLPAFRIHAINGSRWDSEVYDIITVNDGTGGSYSLISRYFLEAAEGHGARFSQMADTFRLESVN